MRLTDHDHLVIAIHGELEDGSTPQAGQTPAFDLSIITEVVDASAPTSTRVICWSGSCGN
jgi:hypothetical protein